MTDIVPAYKILALGAFAPVPDGKFKPDFVKLDLYSIDEAMATIAPVLYLPLPVELCSDGALTLKFNKIKDFKPGSIIKNNPYFISLSDVEKDVQRKVQGGSADKASTKKPDAVDDILSIVAVSDTPSDVSSEGESVDGEINGVLREVFSNIEFQKTESAWRGVQTLVKQAQIKGSNKISVSISPASHNSLEHVFNTVELLPIDEMPNLMLIDLEFDNTMPSIELLEKVIHFVDKMMIPACICLKPDFFRIDDFNQLDKLSYINNHLDDISYAKFRKLKDLAGASWLIVNCNKFAVRSATEFEDQPLSGSSVWATGALCAKAVNDTGWPMGFSRYTKYSIDNLPLFSIDERNTSSAEAIFSDERIIQLVEAGITPVIGVKNKDFVFIPKEAALSCDSIKFQMFFNRIIEALINIREQTSLNLTPQESIKKALTDIFIKTDHDKPEDISVKKENNELQDQDVFLISFSPPSSVIASSNMVEFSFVW